MRIQIDSREKPKAIQKILKCFDDNGIKYLRSKMFVGDYVALENSFLVIDRKKDLLELCQNVGQDHTRFAGELKRARDFGIHITVLCEHGGGIKCLDDVRKWENPRVSESKLATSGERLYKILSAMQTCDKYSVDFQFCNKSETGKKIIELLESGVVSG